eukprot:5760162-Pyramimonas_sp.AAC.1
MGGHERAIPGLGGFAIRRGGQARAGEVPAPRRGVEALRRSQQSPRGIPRAVRRREEVHGSHEKRGELPEVQRERIPHDCRAAEAHRP